MRRLLKNVLALSISATLLFSAAQPTAFADGEDDDWNGNRSQGKNGTTSASTGTNSVTVNAGTSQAGSGGNTGSNSGSGGSGVVVPVCVPQPGKPCRDTEVEEKYVYTYVPPTPPVVETVKEAVLTLDLPVYAPLVQPDPANNEWGLLAVGYPIWMAVTPHPTYVETSAWQNGIFINIKATPGQYVFHMGEGDQLVCPDISYRPKQYTNEKSPNCGFVYYHKGWYTPEVAINWYIEWSALGETGTFWYQSPFVPDTKPLGIGSLTAIIVET